MENLNFNLFSSFEFYRHFSNGYNIFNQDGVFSVWKKNIYKKLYLGIYGFYSIYFYNLSFTDLFKKYDIIEFVDLFNKIDEKDFKYTTYTEWNFSFIDYKKDTLFKNIPKRKKQYIEKYLKLEKKGEILFIKENNINIFKEIQKEHESILGYKGFPISILKNFLKEDYTDMFYLKYKDKVVSSVILFKEDKKIYYFLNVSNLIVRKIHGLGDFLLYKLITYYKNENSIFMLGHTPLYNKSLLNYKLNFATDNFNFKIYKIFKNRFWYSLFKLKEKI